METVLYPGDIAVDEEGELLPGPYFDPADVDTILSETARHWDHSPLTGQPDEDDTLSGGASTRLLLGDNGNDTLSTDGAEYSDPPAGQKPVPIIPEWTETQQSQLQIIGERMPEVLDWLATEQDVEAVRRHLPELLAWSEKRLQVAKGEFRTYLSEAWAGFVNDFIGAAISGSGNILVATSAELDRRLIDELSENYTPEEAAIVVQNLRNLQADDPETFRAILEDLDTAYGTGSGIAADTGKALVSFSR